VEYKKRFKKYNRRFAPVYKFAKSLIQNGKFFPYSAGVKMNRGELKNPPWVSDRNITGGFLYQSTIHLLDMVRWLLGDVKKVECIGQKSVYNEIDDFVLLLTFTSGRIATFFSSAHVSWVFPFERIELFGKHSAIITEEMEKVTFSSGSEGETIMRDYSQYPELVKWGYVEEDRLFVDAVLKEGKSAVSARDGYKSVELVETCYRGIERKQRVDLPLYTSWAEE
jgi:myo-inositol 2-dehydrogenase/D-chiro-inositol 1-dehydrogenase